MLLGSFGEVDFLSTVHPVSSITASQCQGWHRWAQVSEVSHLARLWRMGAQQNFGVCSSEDVAIQGSSHLCLRKPEHFRAPKAHEVVTAASSTLHTAIPLHRRRKYSSKTGEVQLPAVIAREQRERSRLRTALTSPTLKQADMSDCSGEVEAQNVRGQGWRACRWRRPGSLPLPLSSSFLPSVCFRDNPTPTSHFLEHFAPFGLLLLFSRSVVSNSL